MKNHFKRFYLPNNKLYIYQIPHNQMKDHAAIIIRNSNNEILFIQRSMKKSTLPGAWSFPSGTVEENEHVHTTAVREAKEELDIEVESECTLSTMDLPEFQVRLHFILYNIKPESAPTITEPDEIDQIEWMSFQDFFDKFTDDEIGHGLIWLRKNPHILSQLI